MSHSPSSTPLVRQTTSFAVIHVVSIGDTTTSIVARVNRIKMVLLSAKLDHTPKSRHAAATPKFSLARMTIFGPVVVRLVVS